MPGMMDKMAKKALENKNFQQAWEYHCKWFGPMLEPAFAENDAARVHLVAALNKISRKDTKGGMEKLKKLEKACACDADWAAWLFCCGLCHEMAGEQQEMVSFYQKAACMQPDFYYPHGKIAKWAYAQGKYDEAEECYHASIRALENMEMDAMNTLLLSSAWMNLASCLVMAGKYAEAEAALAKSAQIQPEMPKRKGIEIMLYAAMKDENRARAKLEELKTESALLAMGVENVMESVLNGTHPHFNQNT